MSNIKKSISKNMIIETAVQLIDEKEGIKDVTLREIAKQLGCAHTNLYNYFNSLDEIYWEALGKVLLMLLDYTHTSKITEMDAEEKLFHGISKIIDFSIDHPGWYKLVWFETMHGEPSPEVLEVLRRPAESFSYAVMVSSNKGITLEKANLISDILLRYLHGELCMWINQRSFNISRKEMKGQAISNLKLLYQLLLLEGESMT
ncbi:MAG: TetR/AcrR family transcriptional regulator [Bacillota bacterium]